MTIAYVYKQCTVCTNMHPVTVEQSALPGGGVASWRILLLKDLFHHLFGVSYIFRSSITSVLYSVNKEVGLPSLTASN